MTTRRITKLPNGTNVPSRSYLACPKLLGDSHRALSPSVFAWYSDFWRRRIAFVLVPLPHSHARASLYPLSRASPPLGFRRRRRRRCRLSLSLHSISRPPSLSRRRGCAAARFRFSGQLVVRPPPNHRIASPSASQTSKPSRRISPVRSPPTVTAPPDPSHLRVRLSGGILDIRAAGSMTPTAADPPPPPPCYFLVILFWLSFISF
jgi:hypothetical protein